MKRIKFIAGILIIFFVLFFLISCSSSDGGGGSTAPTTVPTVPTGVTATLGNSKVTIAWTAVSHATSYNIYWSTTTGVTPANGTKITGATNPYTQTGLTNGTTYYYVVTAVNSVGESVASTQMSAIPASKAVSIVFNYDYDTNGFFTAPRRALVEQAAATLLARISGSTWAMVDPAVTGGSYELAFINPSTWAVTWSSNVVIPENQITVYLGAVNFSTLGAPMNSSLGYGCTQLMGIRTVVGNMQNVLTSTAQFRPINASISFDLQGIQGFSASHTGQWHFDSDGNLATDDRNPADPNHDNYADFSTAIIHELGHVLGIHNPALFKTMGIITSDPNFCLAWLSRVNAANAFTGSNAKLMYFNGGGSDIPLEAGDICHWASGVKSGASNGSGSGTWTSVTHESDVLRPFRVLFSEMEFQALKDIGYTISAP